MAKKLLIRQIKSRISSKPKQQATLQSLGLRRINMSRVHDDTPVIRGMIDVVKHLIEVKEINQ